MKSGRIPSHTTTTMCSAVPAAWMKAVKKPLTRMAGIKRMRGRVFKRSAPGVKRKSNVPQLRGLAEREGFEPSVLFRYSRFPGVRLKPLSHLSTQDPQFEEVQPGAQRFLKGRSASWDRPKQFWFPQNPSAGRWILGNESI